MYTKITAAHIGFEWMVWISGLNDIFGSQSQNNYESKQQESSISDSNDCQVPLKVKEKSGN